jgi:hypothetical protein
MGDDGFIRPDFGEEGRRAKRALLIGAQFAVIPAAVALLMGVLPEMIRSSEIAWISALVATGMLTGWRVRRARSAIISFGFGYPLVALPLVLSMIGWQGLGSTLPPGFLLTEAAVYGAIWLVGGGICCIGVAEYPRAPGMGALAFGVGGAIGGVLGVLNISVPFLILPPLLCGGLAIGWFTYGSPPRADGVAPTP